VTTRSAQDELQKAVDRFRDHARSFFAELAFAHRTADRARGEERVRATDLSLSHTREVAAYLAGSLDLLEAALALLKPAPDQQEGGSAPPFDSAALARRAGEIRDELRFLLRAGDPAYVYFVEFRGKGIFLRASPIDVSEIIRDLLLDRMQANCPHVRHVDRGWQLRIRASEAGIARAEEIKLPSEFDYATQALLYLPQRMPDPRSPDFAMAAGRQVIELLKRSRGRAFVLFTSYASLRAVQAIAEMALDYPMLVQGTAPRSQLLRQFRETPNCVLFATSSFWQGVDVVGKR
jgi:ATP-dependent DNA helicase DinG